MLAYVIPETAEHKRKPSSLCPHQREPLNDQPSQRRRFMICANPCTIEYTNVHAPIVWYTYKGLRTRV